MSWRHCPCHPPSLPPPQAALLALLTLARPAAAAVNFTSALGPNNVLVVRSVGATTASLDEFLSTTTNQAAPVQTLNVTNCNIATTPVTVYASPSVNGAYAVFPCGLSGGSLVNVARVSFASSVGLLVEGYTSTNLPRGAATLDGTYLYASDYGSVYVGTFGSVSLSSASTSKHYFGSAIGSFSGWRDACGPRAA